MADLPSHADCCPECGKRNLMHVFETVATQPISAFQFESNGYPSFTPSGRARSDFECADRYTFEVIECGDCFHRFATRPSGFANWFAGEEPPFDLVDRFERLCGALVDLSRVMEPNLALAPLFAEAAELLEHAGCNTNLEAA